jgi:RimJ/RimL family protein N-acetyltransferase
MEEKNTPVELVAPNIDRDAPLGVKWLKGEVGKNTMILMGNPPDKIEQTTLNKERERVKGFIESENQKTWMIRFEGRIVGAVWLDLDPTEWLPGAPSIHIMIGDQNCRGKGVGTKAITAVIQNLKEEGRYDTLFSRHMTSNANASNLLTSLGFNKLGEPYLDKDQLEWQNVSLKLGT